MKYFDLTRIAIVSAAEPALKKLARASVAVYNCKKRGADFIFCVKDKDIQKVFAIFKKPCYNIRTEIISPVRRLISSAVLRAGLLAGAALFALFSYIAGFFVLKVEVTGSGSYLKGEVCAIIGENGGGVGKPFSALDAPLATGRILALPQVVFCKIQKRGSVLVADVHVDSSPQNTVDARPLISDRDGTIVRLVAITGYPNAEAGQAVKKGDVLIDAYRADGAPCVVCGLAELKCTLHAEYLAADDSEESLKSAYASVFLDGEEVLSRSHTVKKAEGGTLFVMEIEYLHKITINLT